MSGPRKRFHIRTKDIQGRLKDIPPWTKDVPGGLKHFAPWTKDVPGRLKHFTPRQEMAGSANRWWQLPYTNFAEEKLGMMSRP